MTISDQTKAALMAAHGTFSELIDLMTSNGFPMEIAIEGGLLALLTAKAGEQSHPAEVVSWLRDAADLAEASIIERVTRQ
jgi:uncharacterized membrane protein YphA (DoxX/SURF4 family)